jgi:hypothetical protein
MLSPAGSTDSAPKRFDILGLPILIELGIDGSFSHDSDFRCSVADICSCRLRIAARGWMIQEDSRAVRH